MSKENRERTVQLLAVNSKYKTRTAYISPVYRSSDRTYLMGIEDLGPADKGKILKALGVSEDSEKELQVEELVVPISHRQRLNLKNNEDYGIYCLCMVNDDLVAKNKRSVDPKKHLFFILDVEMEANDDIAIETQQFEAKKKIFDEADPQRLRSLCVYLGGIDIRNLSHNALMARALREAELRPKEIMTFYEGKVENRVFVLELAHYAIIQSKQGRYYDGETYIGTLDEAISYVVNPKNSSHVGSLGKRLLEKKG